MRFSKVAGITLAILLLAGAAVGFGLYRQAAVFLSDPSTPRNNPDYEAALSPPNPLSNAVTNSISFGPSRIETNRNEIKVILPESFSNEKPVLPIIFHSATGISPIELAGGTMRLRYLISGWADPRTNFDYSVRIPGAIYNADLKPMSSNEITVNRWDQELQMRGDFPSAKFFFELKNIPEFKLVRFQLFDARTRRTLTTGSSSSKLPEAISIESQVQLWHQTPVKVVTTLGVGPCEFFDIKPEIGNEIHFPHGALKLIYIVPERINGWGSSSDGKTNIATLYLNRNEVVGNSTESSFVFSVWPTTSDLPFDLELLDQNGKKLYGSGGGSSDRIIISSIFQKPGEVKTIRLRYYPNLHRIDWTLHELPGLPEENRNLKNLFDTRIPYMRIRYEWEYQENLRKLVAMDMTQLPLQYPNGFFPVTLTNFTPRELLKDIESRLPNQQQLSVDPKNNKIELRRSPWEILWEHLKKVFRK